MPVGRQVKFFLPLLFSTRLIAVTSAFTTFLGQTLAVDGGMHLA